MNSVCFAIITLFWISPFAFAGISEHYETNTLADAVAKAQDLGRLYGNDQVLVAFDIDNTLLATQTNLGSHQWFTWQTSLLNRGSTEGLVANDFAGILKAQGILFFLGDMRATEPAEVQSIEELKAMGYPVITLTSRGEDFRTATMRELSDNGYAFETSPLGQGFSDVYFPYDLNNLEASGLTSREVMEWKLGNPRSVTYRSGVYMTSGMHKGAMLRTLLHKTQRPVKAIVFVDDQPNHNQNVQAAFKDKDVHVATYRYGREDAVVEEFHNGDKSEYIRQCNAIHSLIKEIF